MYIARVPFNGVIWNTYQLAALAESSILGGWTVTSRFVEETHVPFLTIQTVGGPLYETLELELSTASTQTQAVELVSKRIEDELLLVPSTIEVEYFMAQPWNGFDDELLVVVVVDEEL